jgi:hypothetical protein
MIRTLKERLVGGRLHRSYNVWRQERAWRAWRASGSPLPPPPEVKQRTIREYARRFALTDLVETGTYAGRTVEACSGMFRRITSIELDPALFAAARARFARHRHIRILQGDSAEVLPRVLAEIAAPTLFWLDGHYSGGITARATLETPIRAELDSILSHAVDGHVVLIDDARCFDGRNDYPTIDELADVVRRADPAYRFEVRDDVVRIHR